MGLLMNLQKSFQSYLHNSWEEVIHISTVPCHTQVDPVSLYLSRHISVPRGGGWSSQWMELACSLNESRWMQKIRAADRKWMRRKHRWALTSSLCCVVLISAPSRVAPHLWPLFAGDKKEWRAWTLAALQIWFNTFTPLYCNCFLPRCSHEVSWICNIIVILDSRRWVVNL